MAQKAVDGIQTPVAVTQDSKDGAKVQAFYEAVEKANWPAERPLFGRANVVVFVGSFVDEETLTKMITAYVNDLGDDVPDEHVVRSVGGVALTIGDLRDFVKPAK